MLSANVMREQVGQDICLASQSDSEERRPKERDGRGSCVSEQQRAHSCDHEDHRLDALRREAIDQETDAQPAENTGPTSHG